MTARRLDTMLKEKSLAEYLRSDQPGQPPEPPDHLPDAAKAKWAEIIGEVDSDGQGVLDLVVLYTTEWARWHHAEEEVAKIGEVVRSPSGFPQANPWLSISRQAFDRLVKLSKRLGIDPHR